MKLNKAVTIISKIAEVCYWIGFGMVGAIVISLIAGHHGLVSKLTDVDPTAGKDLTGFGFSIETVTRDGQTIWGTYVIFFITLFLMLGLMAMICRNIYLIFKTTAGQTKFSKGQTPFQPDNIRMVREIGIYLIAIPIIGLIMSVIARLAMSGVEIESSMDMHFIMVGLVIICLSRYFSYGMELQNEVDGLV